MALNITINKVGMAASFAAGATVATAVASGGTAPYVYSLATGEDKFAINSSTGVVTTIAAMNISNIASFSVTVTDSTTGTPLTATSDVAYPPIQAAIRSKFDRTGVIYKITRDIDLGHGILIIPAGCTLDFQGGSFVNGTIIFNNTIILGTKNTFVNCRFQGSINNTTLNISTFGVIADGVTDDSPIINDILNCINGKNCELFFDCNGDYGVSSPSLRSSIKIGSNTTITFTGKGYFKLLSTSDVGTVVENISGADNIVLNNIKIDGGGDSIITGGSGQNGLSIGRCSNIIVNGGHIRNCSKGHDVPDYPNPGDTYYGDGGKGIQVESYGVQNCVINNVLIENCYFALSSHRNIAQSGNIEAVFNNIYAKNCAQFAIIHQTNGEDTTGLVQNITINNFIAENCGSDLGIFVFSRTRFLKVIGGKILGTTQTPCIFSGRAAKSVFTGIEVYQPVEKVIDINPTKYGQDTSAFSNNVLDIKVYSNYTYLIATDTGITYPNRALINTLLKFFVAYYPATVITLGSVNSSNSLMLDITTYDGKFFNGPIAGLEGYGNVIASLPFGNTTYNVNTTRLITGANIKVTDTAPENQITGDVGSMVQITSTIPEPAPVAFKETATNLKYGWRYPLMLRQWTDTNRPSGYQVTSQGIYGYNATSQIMEVWSGTSFIDPFGFKSCRRRGNTTDRPTLGANDGGITYWDTTIAKLILWNGTAWVNMDGTVLA